MNNTTMSMNHALSSHLLESFDQSRRASTPAFGTQRTDMFHHGYSPAAHGNLSQMTAFSNFSSADQLAEMQAKLNRKLGPEFISQRPGPGGGPKLTYAEGWKVINLANEVFGFNGWSSSVLSITTDYIDYNEGTQRYNVGVSAIIRVTLRDGAFHEDVGFGALENARGKGIALDKCKKEAVTDGLKRTLRNFGNLLGNCLYDKQYAADILKIKAPAVKLDKDALHRRPDLAGPVPTMPIPGGAPQPSISSSPHNQLANTTMHRPVGNPSPLATSTPITNRTVQNPTPDTSVEHPNSSTTRATGLASALRRAQEQNAPLNTATNVGASTSSASVRHMSPSEPLTTIQAAPPQLQRTDSGPRLFDNQLAGELALEGSIYGSEDDAFFDNILPGEIDMDVPEVPSAPAPQNVEAPSENRRSPSAQPGQKPVSDSNAECLTSSRPEPGSSSTTPNPESSNPNPTRPTKIRLADAIRGGGPGPRNTAGDKRTAPPEPVGQKRQRTS